jgi:hypothetical protein
MSLEKQKNELEFEIEHEADPVRLKLLEKALDKVLKLIDEMNVRIRWLLEQSASTSPAKSVKSASSLSILTILSLKNTRASFALGNVANLQDWELWVLISSIACEESADRRAPFGFAIGSSLLPKLSDWKKMQPRLSNAFTHDSSAALKKRPKP